MFIFTVNLIESLLSFFLSSSSLNYTPKSDTVELRYHEYNEYLEYNGYVDVLTTYF